MNGEEMQDHILSNRWYDRFKFLVEIFLPAAAAFYVSLSLLWGLPAGEKVAGTIAALAVLLGVFLRRATKSYNESTAKYDGELVVSETPDMKSHTLNVFGDPYELDQKDEVIFRVVPAE